VAGSADGRIHQELDDVLEFIRTHAHAMKTLVEMAVPPPKGLHQ